MNFKSLIILAILLAVLSPPILVRAQSDGTAFEAINPQNVDQLIKIAELGRGWIHQVAWSPDGTMLAIATSNGLYIYNAGNWGVPPHALPRYDDTVVRAIAWQPNGDQLVSVDSHGYFRLWRIESFYDFDPIELDIAQIEVDEESEPYFDSYARDSRLTRNLAYDTQGNVLIFVELENIDSGVWNATIGTFLERDKDYQLVHGIAVFPDGTILGTETWDFIPYAVTPDAKTIAIAPCLGVYRERQCPQGVVELYDVATGELSKEILTHHVQTSQKNINAIDISPDNLMAVGGCGVAPPVDSTRPCPEFDVVIKNLATDEDVPAPNTYFFNEIQSLAFSSNGQKIAAADSTIIHIWEVTNPEVDHPLTGFGGPVTDIVFHPEGEYWVAGHFSGNWFSRVTNFWNVSSFDTGNPLATIPSSGPFVFTADGEKLIAGNAAYTFGGELDTGQMWNVSHITKPALIGGGLLSAGERAFVEILGGFDVGNITSLSRDMKGAWITATTLFGQDAVFWNTTTDTLKFLEIGVSDSHVLISPDGELTAIIIRSLDGPILIFETKTLLAYPSNIDFFQDIEPYMQIDHAYKVAFSPDSRTIVTIHSDHTLYFWDITTKQKINDLEGLLAQNLGGELWAAAFNHAGNLLAVGGCSYRPDAELCGEGFIWLIDMATFTILRCIQTGSETVNVISFSPNDTLLALGSGTLHYYMDKSVNVDNGLQVWGVPTHD